MSKPKPGLAKKVVRTLASHPPVASSSAAHALQLGPGASQHAYSTISAASSASSAASGRREQLQAFRDLGLPAPPSWALSQSFSTLSFADRPPSLHAGWETTTGGWANDVVVQSYQPERSRSPLFPPKRLLQTPPHQHIRHRRSYTTSTRPVSREALNFVPNPDGMLPLINKGFDAASISLESLNLGQHFFQGNADPPLPPSFPPSFHRPPTPNSTDEPHTSLSSALPAPDPSPIEQSLFHPAYLAAQAVTQAVTPHTDPVASVATNTYSSSLIFHLGASGLAKERPVRLSRPSSSLTESPPPRPRSFPLPEVEAPKSLRSVGVGEDAYFVRLDGMCVADGVGGWAKSGRSSADAGRWSRLLTHFCEAEVGLWWAGAEAYLADVGGMGKEEGWKWRKKADASSSGAAEDSAGLEEGKRRRPMDPVEIMQRGFEKCLACMIKEGINGSSTCLLALLHHSTLHIANLGDCALLLIRQGEIIFRTSEMQHAFNFPLQLGTHSRDEPMKDARRYDVGVTRGDIVILGSDGLMDNLFDEEIVETLEHFAPPAVAGLPTPPPSPGTAGRPAFSPQKVSEALCRRARQVSEETSATTPFMMRAIEEGIDFVGGKKDDISVVVGVIGDREEGQGHLAIHTR